MSVVGISYCMYLTSTLQTSLNHSFPLILFPVLCQLFFLMTDQTRSSMWRGLFGVTVQGCSPSWGRHGGAWHCLWWLEVAGWLAHSSADQEAESWGRRGAGMLAQTLSWYIRFHNPSKQCNSWRQGSYRALPHSSTVQTSKP